MSIGTVSDRTVHDGSYHFMEKIVSLRPSSIDKKLDKILRVLLKVKESTQLRMDGGKKAKDEVIIVNGDADENGTGEDKELS